MESLVLNRLHDYEGIIRGELILPGCYFYTLELPWRDNELCKSCIPGGTYTIQKAANGRWNLLNVPGRTEIQIHVGNTAADTTGCIIIGKSRGILEGLPAVLESKAAMEEFNNAMGEVKEALLSIRNCYC
jgi:hypothetical protein